MPDLKQWSMPRLLSTAARLVEHAWNEGLAALNLTHAGVIALEVLEAEGPMSQTRLAGRVRVQGQTMGKTLTRLETYGHVLRQRSHSDRRIQDIRISKEGRRVVEEARRLERLLGSGDDSQNTGLNKRLATIIRSLGSNRFNAGAPGGDVRPNASGTIPGHRACG